MKIDVPYGRTIQSCILPEKSDVIYGSLSQIEPKGTAYSYLNTALENLIGKMDLDKLRQAKSVAIAISDITRPVPSKIILECLLPWLERFEIKPEGITLIIGGGLHRLVTRQDIEYILGAKIIAEIKRIIAHDSENPEMLKYLGISAKGTPVFVNKYFAEADFRIVTGLIDAHQFMGFSGGVKGAVIGLGGRATITSNHALLFNDGAEIGRLNGNPVRNDLEDIGRIMGIDMIVNVVLNDKKKVIKAVAGHPVAAHREGVDFAKGVLGVEIRETDVVIASPGGFPKDINIYQAQKALIPASQIVKTGGTIILVAECLEGSGEKGFEEEMSLYKNPEDILRFFRDKDFTVGPHKAYLWAKALVKARVILVSNIIDTKMADLFMVGKKDTLQEALDTIVNKSECQSVAVLPYASSVIPIISNSGY